MLKQMSKTPHACSRKESTHFPFVTIDFGKPAQTKNHPRFRSGLERETGVGWKEKIGGIFQGLSPRRLREQILFYET